VMQIIETARNSLPTGMDDVVIEKVNIKVGRHSCVMPENLRFCFNAAIEGTSLAGTKLNIEEIPVIIRCNSCHVEWIVDEIVFMCIKCTSKNIDVISGRELEIVSIDIED